MNCPICGTELSEDAEKCYVCGYRQEHIEQEQPFEDEIDIITEKETSEVEGIDAGEDVDSDAEKGVNEKKDYPVKSRRTVRSAVLILLFLIAVSAVGIFYISQDDGKGSQDPDKKVEEKEDEPVTDNRKSTRSEEGEAEESEAEESEADAGAGENTLDLNKYVGYWNMTNNTARELTIHNIEGDTVKFSLWYYRLCSIDNVIASLQGKIANFSTSIDGQEVKGALIFEDSCIEVRIIESDQMYMPVEDMIYEERHTPSWQQGDLIGGQQINGQYSDAYTQPELEPYPNEARSAEYILMDSSTRELTSSDLYGMSSEQLELARNEIYARHGRKFDDPDIRAYFEAQSWYNGVIEPEDFTEDMLSEIEKRNIQFIKSYE